MSATATADPAQKLAEDIEREEQEAQYQRDNGREDQAAAHDEEVTRLRTKLDQLRAEAGEATSHEDPAAEAAAAQARDADAEALPMDVVVAGLDEMGFFKAGGKAPSSGVLKLTGTTVKLHEGTGIKKGRRIRGTYEAVVDDLRQKDTTDPATGQVTECTQIHSARLVDMTIEAV